MEYIFTIATVLFLASFATAGGQYYSHLKNGKKATVVHIIHPHERVKRSPQLRESVFKETMDFTVTMETGSVITLHLKLNKKQIGKVLVKIISESGTELFDNTKPRDYRFYQVIGEDHGASVMVRCEKFRHPCYIAGSFYYKSAEYVIDPDTDIAHRVSFIPHTVYEIVPGDRKHAYDHDTVKMVVDGNKRGHNQRTRNLLVNLFKLHKSRKTKRQTTRKTYKVELEMLVDDSIYDFWFERMAQNHDAAVEKIEQYMEQVANNMDLRFSAATTETMAVDIVPLFVTIIKDRVNSSFITDNIVAINGEDEAYNSDTALDDLYDWALSNKNPRADALACFSKRDIWGGGQSQFSSTVGIASYPIDNAENPLSGLCTAFAVSLNEDLRNGDTSATSSHELGHNMGLLHDAAPCLNDYIMSSSLGFVSSVADAKNPWTFSSCSVQEMERLMSTIDTDADGLTCLERNSYDVNDYNTIRTSDLLGELYTTDQQCELLLGVGSTHCRGTSIQDDEICWKGLPCEGPGSGCPVVAPLSGSSCGGTKKCYEGLCVDSIPTVVTEAAPTQSSTTTTSTTTSSTSTSTSTTTSSTTTTSTPTTTSSTTTTTPTTTSSTTTTTPTMTSSTTTTTPTMTSSTTTTTPTTTSSTTTTTPTTTSSTTTTTPTTTSSTTTTTPTTTSSTTTTTTTPTTTSSTTTTTTPTTTSSTTTTTTPTTTSSSTTTSTTSPSTTSSTTTSTPTTASSTTTTAPTSSTSTVSTTTTSSPFSQNEWSWLNYFFSRCHNYCRCWRKYCRWFGRKRLCRRFFKEYDFCN